MKKRPNVGASFTASTSDTVSDPCVLCKSHKHPLYACPQFKSLSHDKMISTLKSHNLCMNCLRPGHFVRECKSLHRCRKCQKSHHTLLHLEAKDHVSAPTSQSVTSNAAAGISSKSLLMTCRILVDTPDGSSVEARAVLDSASSTSFVSEHFFLKVCASHAPTRIYRFQESLVSHKSPLQALANFSISPVQDTSKKFKVTAIVVPRVTCDLPIHPVHFDLKWNHLEDIHCVICC